MDLEHKKKMQEREDEERRILMREREAAAPFNGALHAMSGFQQRQMDMERDALRGMSEEEVRRLRMLRETELERERMHHAGHHGGSSMSERERLLQERERALQERERS